MVSRSVMTADPDHVSKALHEIAAEMQRQIEAKNLQHSKINDFGFELDYTAFGRIYTISMKVSFDATTPISLANH